EKMGFIPWAPIGGGRNPSLRKTGNALEAEAKQHNVSVVQLALAWLLQKSPVMLPIPGTSSLGHLEENMAAEKLQLSAEEWKRIEDLARTSGELRSCRKSSKRRPRLRRRLRRGRRSLVSP